MRKENWPELLNEFLEKPHPFNWSTCNCALFAADAVEAVTGKDFAKKYRGPKTKKGMISRLLRVCGGGVVAAATKELGAPKPVSLAKRADVVAVLLDGDHALGVCIGQKSVFVSENEGLIHIKTLDCTTAWTI